MIAVDGKSVRGAMGANGRARHLLAAVDHDSDVVLGQLDVDGKTNEISMFAPLLDTIDLPGCVVTADAMHARYLVADRDADYLLVVKANQPILHQQLWALPWMQVPVADTGATVATGVSNGAPSRWSRCAPV